MSTWESNYLAHYGVSGQKWHVRRFQNEDGTLTDEGRQHYGIGEGYGYNRQNASQYNRQTLIRPRFSGSIVRVGKKTDGVLRNRPSQSGNSQRSKERAKKIILAAGAVTLTAAIAYALHKRHKTTTNLIELAKNRVHSDYTNIGKGLKGSDLAKNDYWKWHDMNAIRSRGDAKKVLGLRSRSQAKAFIKNNNISKLRTIDIVERRAGPLAQGYRKTVFGNWKPIKGLRLDRLKKKTLKSLRFL